MTFDDGSLDEPTPQTPETPAPDVLLILTVREHDVIEVWQRQGRTGAEVAALLRHIAGHFERGEVRRVG